MSECATADRNHFKWNNDLIFELIDLYRDRPVLWDNTLEDNKDRDKKLDAWCEIASGLKKDKASVQKKMRSLIVQYRRENQREVPTAEEEEESNDNLVIDEQITEEELRNGTQELHAGSSHGDRKRPLSRLSSRSEETHGSTTDISKEREMKDEYSAFGEVVAIKLRKIRNNYVRSTAQFRIHNILHKAEIGAYDI